MALWKKTVNPPNPRSMRKHAALTRVTAYVSAKSQRRLRREGSATLHVPSALIPLVVTDATAVCDPSSDPKGRFAVLSLHSDAELQVVQTSHLNDHLEIAK